ncbi:hypothetical protein EDD32_3587 [Georgenia muralis]|uniref:Uncharacterized protein n=1 Tax=Georgenia muralis TaxID=154117 RepID=A0A3N5A6L2_9MICO|nr:hypothetical protein EDD32_3587 [Georgenia muralis]
MLPEGKSVVGNVRLSAHQLSESVHGDFSVVEDALENHLLMHGGTASRFSPPT